MEHDYLIAGLRVRMDSFGRTLSQAEPYLTETVGQADITITSNPQSLKDRQPHLSLDDCEYLCTGGSFYRQLLDFDGMLLHSSAVVMDGYAYLFSAPCGTGKSTHTNMWRAAFGEAVVMLNDDKPALRKEDDCWYAYGTPWSGKTDQNINMRVPIGGICVLSRGEINEIEPYYGAKAIFSLLDQTVRPKMANVRTRLLELLDDLMLSVPMWKLRCTPTKEAALISQAAMSKEAIKRFGGKQS
ncbi:MAG: hypothetical protein E7656_03595 [Ruminococcaceae bacterium]|nr:hypothetical protein [Oscillospiraceae bacterium]